MATLDLLYLHPSAIRRRPSFALMPAGAFTMLNHLRSHRFEVAAVNEALELALDKRYDVTETLRELEAPVYAIDLHWHEHSHGALTLARTIKERQPDATVVLGGITASRYAGEILADHPEVDHVVSGYGEEALLGLLQDRQRGAAPARGTVLSATEPLDLDRYNQVDHDMLRHAHEYAWASIHGLRPKGTSRGFWYRNGVGCTRHCSYCGGASASHAQVFGHRRPLRRSPERIAEDLVALVDRDINLVCFTNDISSGPADYWKALFEAVRSSGVRIGIYLETNGVPSPAFVRQLARTFVPSISAVVFTPLCADEKVRAANGKRFSDRALLASLRAVKAAGFGVVLYFADGLPGGGADNRAKTLAFKAALEAEFKPMMSVITGLTLDPGSPMQSHSETFGVSPRLRTLRDYVERSRARSEGRPYDERGYALSREPVGDRVGTT